MDHQRYREWLQLWFYDELNDDERLLLETHLAACAECAAERRKLEQFHRALASFKPAATVDALVQEARAELRVALREEKNKRSFVKSIIAAAGEIFSIPKYQVAFASSAMLVVGLVVGMNLAGRSESIDGFQTAVTQPGSLFPRNDAQISNFKFLRQDEKTGAVEFTFEATSPVRMTGNANDPSVQQVLARAAVSDQNPGVRLRAVSTIAENVVPQPSNGNPEVKQALIAVLKHDRNPGVRQEALKALQKYLPDPEATQAIIYILKNETNTGIKIAAINALDLAKFQGKSSNDELLEMLKEKVQSDENNYIRLRARAALKEIQK
ncbi:MAG: HEAT repeat domain-containing protein [Ignavibacteriales bacterium]|nr:HEAT repeat domain-containing protein [Ignavibacteriales bacterium]